MRFHRISPCPKCGGKVKAKWEAYQLLSALIVGVRLLQAPLIYGTVTVRTGDVTWACLAVPFDEHETETTKQSEDAK